MKIKKVEEWNENFKNWGGFNKYGETWMVLGDTYSIKDELKEKGAKFSRELGWHFDHMEPGYKSQMVEIEDVTSVYPDGRLYWNDEAVANLEKIRKDSIVYEETDSEWVGEIGEKVEVKVRLENDRYFEGTFGVTGVFQFKDDKGNTIVWMTAPSKGFDYEHTYILVGTVKDHTEYKGDKQTRLTRCKIKEAIKDE